ncbi:MAG: DNA phosphorothioation system sulfurtransferase DndC [Gammaproteobacteria bacterium]|nr:DNA phosphorothioation system sulfurtransferase DndC [Gammaproteobacteria bacterium]
MNKATLVKIAPVEQQNKILRAIERFDFAMKVIRKEYLRKHSDPWVVAYSGGKDSTLLLQLIWEMLLSLPEHNRQRKVYVIGNDTLVESPLVIRHLRDTISTIAYAAAAAGLPIKTQITKPHIDQTFWVNVIGRGYIPPTRNFRWCTDRMKIVPTSQLLKRLISIHKRTILLVGTRKSESVNRRRNMSKHGVSGVKMNPHSSVDGCRMFAPLAEFEDDDVWVLLLQRKPPWGGAHRNLITLYRNAGGGECPLVLTKDDAPSCGTTSPRFGCWTCTVISKDRSLRGLIDSGHEDAKNFSRLFNFREWLIELREENSNRENVRRDGNSRYRTDGTLIMGPFKLEVRRKILKRLQELEQEIGQRLISTSELDVIKDIWHRDRVREDCRDALSATVTRETDEILT